MKTATMKVNYTQRTIEALNLKLDVHFTDYRDFNRVSFDQESFERFVSEVNKNGMENFLQTYNECEAFEEEKRTKFGITSIRKNGVYTQFYGIGKDTDSIRDEISNENKANNPDDSYIFTGGCTYFYHTFDEMMKVINKNIKKGFACVSLLPSDWNQITA